MALGRGIKYLNPDMVRRMWLGFHYRVHSLSQQEDRQHGKHENQFDWAALGFFLGVFNFSSGGASFFDEVFGRAGVSVVGGASGGTFSGSIVIGPLILAEASFFNSPVNL